MTHQETASSHDLIENRIGVFLSLLLTIIVSVWVGSSESDTKYAIYALPGLMILTCAVLMRWRVSVELLSFRTLAIATALLVLAIEFALARVGQRRIGRLLAAVIYISLAIVMCTDNPLIYVFYFAGLFLILRIQEPLGRTDTAIRQPVPLRQPSGVLR